MRDTNERLGRVRAALAHDLKGPLSSIALYAQVAMRSDHADEALLSHLMTIRSLTDKTAAMLEGLAAWLAIEPLGDVGAVNLDACIQPVVDSELSNTALQTTVALKHTVRGDCGQLAALFGHILKNVVVHSGATTVDIRSEAADSSVIITVSDNGRGLVPGQNDRLLELFAVSPGSDDHVGVGLALAARYAEVNDGTVRLESDGSGCRVVVRLKAASAGAEGAQSEAAGDR